MSQQIYIKDIESYNQKIIGGDLILTPKKKYVTENELNMINIAKSKINKCLIKDKEDKIISTNTKYRSILTDIYKTMATQKILQATRFNFKLTNEERFTGLATLPEHKYPVFADSLGVLEAKLQATHDGGDHWIYVAKVSSGRVFDGSPLLYYGGSYSSVNPKA